MGKIADSLNNFWKIAVSPIKTNCDNLSEGLDSANTRIDNLEEEIGGGGAGVEIADVTGASVTAGHGRVSLKWTDPNDVTLDGAVIARWGGTLIVRKAGSAPSSKSDGTIVVDSKTRNAYASTAFVDSGLTDGTTYYYRFFPYTKAGTYTTGTVLSATPARTKITTVPSQSGSLTYDGTEKTPSWNNYDTGKMTLSVTAQTKAGTYKATFTPLEDYCWSDGSTTGKEVNWTIGKANGSVTLSPSSLTLNSSATSGSFTVNRAGDGEISMSSSDTSVATVSKNGTTGNVNSVNGKSGTATITVNVAEGTNHLAASATLEVTAKFFSTMTVKLNFADSNPATWATYADDAEGMTAGSSAWDDFFGHYPVMLKGGVEGKKLNPSNFAKHADGTSADITSGSEGDVMIAFPIRGLKISTSGDVVTISMTDNPNDSNFEYNAHLRGSTKKDVFYLGAYKGSEVSSALRSLSGKAPAVNKTIGAFRTLARANSPASNGSGGSGYDQSGFYQLIFRQAMYLLKYKGQNAQIAVGRGYVDGNSAAVNTGGTDALGMDYGETTGKKQMKLFGLEDFYGNVWEWIDGLFNDSSRNILTGTQGFNDTGSGYTNNGQGSTANVSGWIKKVQGSTKTGFIIKEASGSETTYLCDYALLSTGYLPIFGGTWINTADAGVFSLYVNYSASYAYSNIGARLMYL